MSQQDSGGKNDNPACPECSQWTWVVVEGDAYLIAARCAGRIADGPSQDIGVS